MLPSTIIDPVEGGCNAVAQEVLQAKDLTKKHGGVMYLWLGQICVGGGAPAVLVAVWMANGRGVDGGPEQRFDGGRSGGGSCGSRRGGASCSGRRGGDSGSLVSGLA
jgi:hypothetical protein